ncbi:MAG TPA: CPBP family intramembrane glutamic endopeptidase [Acidimicrobiia bacterium]
MGGERPGPGRATVASVVGLLAMWNLVVNLALPSVAYVPANALAAAGLLLIGRRRALSWAQLGVGRDQAGAGLRLGIAAGAAIAVVIGGLVAWPWSRRFFEDGSLVGVGVAGMLYQVLVRIPLGTALFEEVAFRGVLLGVWRRAGLRAAGPATSALFGLWHVLPSLGRLDLNPAGGYAVTLAAEAGIVAGAVAFTAIAGLGFVWLRERSGGLVAPTCAHAMVNSSAYLLGWLVAG